jgi:hypothetical protein
LNNTQTASLGNLKPNDVQSPLDEPKVRKAQEELASNMTIKQKNKYFPVIDTYKSNIINEQNYDSEKQPFKVGDFVYRSKIPGPLYKGSEENKRDEIFIIQKIATNRNVKRYYLLNLNEKQEPSSYYAANLKLVPLKAQPTEKTAYRVDYIMVIMSSCELNHIF